MMGDPRGRRARWTAAAVLAPVAAAVFAGTTAWANAHDPNALAATTTAQPKPKHTVDPVLVKLRKQVHQQTHDVALMRRNIKALHRKARAIANAPVPTYSSGSGYTYTSSGGSTYTSSGGSSVSSGTGSSGSSGSSGGTSTTPSTPAPPPPTPHTTTGASTPPP